MNDRELASVIWFGLFASWALTRRDVRQALIPVVTSLVSPKLAIPMLAMLAWIVALVYGASRIDIWEMGLLGDTISWLLITSVGLFGNAMTVFKAGGSFRGLALAAVKWTVFVEVFVNLFILPLPIELVLLPVVVVLVALSVVASTKDEWALLKRLLDGLTTLIGLTLLIYATVRLVTDYGDFDAVDDLRKFLLPVWLAVGTLPFVAVLGIYANYDTAFSMIRWATDDRRRRNRARIALVSIVHLRPREVGRFTGIWAKELTAADTDSEARAVVRRFRDHKTRVDIRASHAFSRPGSTVV